MSKQSEEREMTTFVTIHQGVLSNGILIKNITLPLVSPIIKKSGLNFGAKFRGTFDSTGISGIQNRINLRVLFNSDRDFSYASQSETTTAPFQFVSEQQNDVFVPEVETRSDEDLIKEMNDKFEVIQLLTQSIGSGNSIRSMVVSGSPGTGKSFSVFHELKELKKNNKELNFIILSGTISAIKLYVALWENSEKRNIIVLDDCDAVVEDIEALNMIKAATDTKKVRTIHYNKKSSYLEENGIPNAFDYFGGIIYLSNINFAQEVERKTKLAPHVEAFISRSHYINVSMTTSRERILRIKSVIHSELFKSENGINDEQANQIEDWLMNHQDRLIEISIRTAVKLSDLMRDFPSKWETIARVTLCK